jgi:hypothetical protein
MQICVLDYGGCNDAEQDLRLLASDDGRLTTNSGTSPRTDSVAQGWLPHHRLKSRFSSTLTDI